jgi:hypothetical protein
MSHNVSYAIKCLRLLANTVAKDYQDKNMSTELIDRTDKFYQSLRKTIEWQDLTREDFLKLGFINCGYEDEDEWELWLIPMWLYDAIPDGIQLVDINHNIFTFKRGQTPFEIFYGCMTYGIRIPNPTYGKSLMEIIEEIPDDN